VAVVNADRKQERAPVENRSTMSSKLFGDWSLVHTPQAGQTDNMLPASEPLGGQDESQLL
jgi:hypothetical protein